LGPPPQPPTPKTPIPNPQSPIPFSYDNENNFKVNK